MNLPMRASNTCGSVSGVETSIPCFLHSSTKLGILSSSDHMHQLSSPVFKSGNGPNCLVSSSVTSI